MKALLLLRLHQQPLPRLEQYRILSTFTPIAADMIVPDHVSNVTTPAAAIPALNPAVARGQNGHVEWEGIKGNRSWPPVPAASKVSMMPV